MDMKNDVIVVTTCKFFTYSRNKKVRIDILLRIFFKASLYIYLIYTNQVVISIAILPINVTTNNLALSNQGKKSITKNESKIHPLL